MTGTTIQVTGPKRLLRALYKQAHREHVAGSPFAGVFDQVIRMKADDGHHELALSRFGYLPLSTAREALEPKLDAIAAEAGLEAERAQVRVEARPSFWGARSLLA